jgi:hypothetical protein
MKKVVDKRSESRLKAAPLLAQNKQRFPGSAQVEMRKKFEKLKKKLAF